MRYDNRFMKSISEFGKNLTFRYTPFGAPHYPYPNMEPIELAFLVMEIERLRGTVGSILEIGVARGMTTRFMAEQIKASGSSDQIYAIDTFSSFVEADVSYEVQHRGKQRYEISAFAYNDFSVWKRNFRNFPFVKPIQADCSTFDYTRVAPVKIAFLDVDLYRPTKNTIQKLWDVLISDGVILVDDVFDNHTYDGSFAAYHEFCARMDITPHIVGNKGGVLRKSASRIVNG